MYSAILYKKPTTFGRLIMHFPGLYSDCGYHNGALLYCVQHILKVTVRNIVYHKLQMCFVVEWYSTYKRTFIALTERN